MFKPVTLLILLSCAACTGSQAHPSVSWFYVPESDQWHELTAQDQPQDGEFTESEANRMGIHRGQISQGRE